MNKSKIAILIASIYGFLFVAIGAFASHGIDLPPKETAVLKIAMTYLAFHTIMIFIMVVFTNIYSTLRFYKSAWFFIAGVFLFSGSLILMAFTSSYWLGAVTPIGGVSFLIGWMFLFIDILKYKHSSATQT